MVLADVLRVATVAVEDPGPLLDLLPPDGALAWLLDGEGLVGWGEVARVTLDGPDRFADAQRWWASLVASATVDDQVGVAGSGLVAFGSFAFDGAAATSVLVVPQVVVGHRDGTWWRTTIGSTPPSERVAVTPTAGVRLEDGSRTPEQWEAVVAEGVRRVRAGELSKVVLARDVLAVADSPVDVRWPLERLAERYPACWTFSVDGLLGATPEMLVRLRGSEVTSRVLAGTLRRSGNANQDLRQSDGLARSIKDVEEHGYGVRSVADALAPHCSEIDVPADPFVLQLPNVMHLASDVRGTVADGSTSLDLVGALHPSAAVCGTPTAVAFEVIREIEGLARDRYAGPVGWVDASGDGEWGIALRCGLVAPDRLSVRLFAGCGIVDGSVPASELAESRAKLLPMREALAAVDT